MISLDKFYPFNEAKEVVREFAKERHIGSTNGNASPNGGCSMERVFLLRLLKYSDWWFCSV